MQIISIALAETILARYPDPDQIPYKPWCYVQGYILAGFEKLWMRSGDPRYFDYVHRFVDQHVTAVGVLQGFTGESLDDMMAAALIPSIYQATGEAKYRTAAEKVRAAFIDYPRNADGGFWHARALPHEMWIDGLFMGGMFLTRYAAMGDREACFDEVTHQITCLAAHCRKADIGLYLHGFDEARQAAWADPITELSSEVWSEGLGWYALILVELLEVLPVQHARRPAVLAILLDLLDGLFRTQDPETGMWFQVVDRGEQADNWQDTSGSAMFIYALQRAADLGWAGSQRCALAAQKGYAGLLTRMQVGADGRVDILNACDGVCVQNSYADYVNYPRCVNAKEAVGSCLWAATVMEKPGKHASPRHG